MRKLFVFPFGNYLKEIVFRLQFKYLNRPPDGSTSAGCMSDMPFYF